MRQGRLGASAMAAVSWLWKSGEFNQITCSAARPQREFENRRQSRSRRGNEAEVSFAPKSAFARRRLPFLNTPWAREMFARRGEHFGCRCGLHSRGGSNGADAGGFSHSDRGATPSFHRFE